MIALAIHAQIFREGDALVIEHLGSHLRTRRFFVWPLWKAPPGLMKALRIYKTIPGDAVFLEVEHLGNKRQRFDERVVPVVRRARKALPNWEFRLHLGTQGRSFTIAHGYITETK